MPTPEEIRAWENEPAATEDDSYGQGCGDDPDPEQ